MRCFMMTIALLSLCFAIATAEEAQKAFWCDFEGTSVGQLPKGWVATQTGEGKGSVWKVAADISSSKGPHVLAQTSESPGSVFNLCVAEAASFKDVRLTVSFKAIAGQNDQGGGLVWRFLDADNYYVARMNPLEGNFRLFKVVDGKRKQLASKGGLKVQVGEWHTIGVTVKGNSIECSFDGEKYLETNDDVFSKAGKVGLWTKADAKTYFEDFGAVAVE